MVKYELTVANALREAERAEKNLVGEEKSRMFEKSLAALSARVGIEPVGVPPTGLVPLGHTAPLGFALAVQWWLELLCKMQKFVPSDEVGVRPQNDSE